MLSFTAAYVSKYHTFSFFIIHLFNKTHYLFLFSYFTFIFNCKKIMLKKAYFEVWVEKVVL